MLLEIFCKCCWNRVCGFRMGVHPGGEESLFVQTWSHVIYLTRLRQSSGPATLATNCPWCIPRKLSISYGHQTVALQPKYDVFALESLVLGTWYLVLGLRTTPIGQPHIFLCPPACPACLCLPLPLPQTFAFPGMLSQHVRSFVHFAGHGRQLLFCQRVRQLMADIFSAIYLLFSCGWQVGFVPQRTWRIQRKIWISKLSACFS